METISQGFRHRNYYLTDLGQSSFFDLLLWSPEDEIVGFVLMNEDGVEIERKNGNRYNAELLTDAIDIMLKGEGLR